MATTFPVSTYPLEEATRMEDDDPVMLDVLDDGEMRLRVLGTSSYQRIRCSFTPMTPQQKDTFAAYIRTNRAVEFDLTTDSTSPTILYRGYIVPATARYNPRSGYYSVTMDFRGKVV